MQLMNNYFQAVFVKQPLALWSMLIRSILPLQNTIFFFYILSQNQCGNISNTIYKPHSNKQCLRKCVTSISFLLSLFNKIFTTKQHVKYFSILHTDLSFHHNYSSVPHCHLVTTQHVVTNWQHFKAPYLTQMKFQHCGNSSVFPTRVFLNNLTQHTIVATPHNLTHYITLHHISTTQHLLITQHLLPHQTLAQPSTPCPPLPPQDPPSGRQETPTPPLPPRSWPRGPPESVSNLTSPTQTSPTALRWELSSTGQLN